MEMIINCNSARLPPHGSHLWKELPVLSGLGRIHEWSFADTIFEAAMTKAIGRQCWAHMYGLFLGCNLIGARYRRWGTWVQCSANTWVVIFSSSYWSKCRWYEMTEISPSVSLASHRSAHKFSSPLLSDPSVPGGVIARANCLLTSTTE